MFISEIKRRYKRCFGKNQISSHFLYGAECSEYFEFNWIILLAVRQMGTAKSAADLFLVKMVVSLKITVMWRTHPQKFKCSTKKFYNKQLCTFCTFSPFSHSNLPKEDVSLHEACIIYNKWTFVDAPERSGERFVLHSPVWMDRIVVGRNI